MSFEKKLNGNVGATIKVVNALASLLVLLMMGMLWLGGRTDTPAEKEKRITNMVAPMSQQVQQNSRDIGNLTELLKEHAKLAGHPVMVERVRQATEGN